MKKLLLLVFALAFFAPALTQAGLAPRRVSLSALPKWTLFQVADGRNLFIYLTTLNVETKTKIRKWVPHYEDKDASNITYYFVPQERAEAFKAEIYDLSHDFTVKQIEKKFCIHDPQELRHKTIGIPAEQLFYEIHVDGISSLEFLFEEGVLNLKSLQLFSKSYLEGDRLFGLSKKGLIKVDHISESSGTEEGFEQPDPEGKAAPVKTETPYTKLVWNVPAALAENFNYIQKGDPREVILGWFDPNTKECLDQFDDPPTFTIVAD